MRNLDNMTVHELMLLAKDIDKRIEEKKKEQLQSRTFCRIIEDFNILSKDFPNTWITIYDEDKREEISVQAKNCGFKANSNDGVYISGY